MSYAITRNAKLVRPKVPPSERHGKRKTKNHSNKDIDKTRTHLNYFIKDSEISYLKAFDKLKEETNLQGQIRSNSIIMCEMIFTSDTQFFEGIGEKETSVYDRLKLTP